MQFIDTHIHLQDYKSKDSPQILAEAAAAGVDKVVCAAVREADWAKVAELALKHPQQIIPAFGLHPWYVNEAADGWSERLRELLQKHPQALIGECGLDYLKVSETERQETVFAEHLKLAEILKRPVLVHAVKAQNQLEKFWPQLKNTRFVLHAFSGSSELLKRAVGFGAYISLAPSFLRRGKWQTVAAAVPKDRLLFESDAPYQGQPPDIPALAAEIALAQNTTFEKLSLQVYQNSEKFIVV